MALKLNKSVSYPTRGELNEFGRNICHVQDPGAVVERIADAMSATLAEEGSRMSREFLAQLRSEWDAGRFSVAPSKVFSKSNKAIQD
jgi:serine/threonine-protein kinase HipA